MAERRAGSAAVVAVRWLARVWSVVSVVLIGAMAMDGGGVPTAREAVALALFPVGVVAGFGIAWWRERLGGLVSVASLAGFYAWMTAMGRFPGGPYFLVAAAPGFLFLVAGVMAGAGAGGEQVSR